MSATQQSIKEHKVLILGAGVCGLYAGLTLVRAGAEVLILEKEEKIGGLAAGFQFGKNTCDFGVHMLHAFHPEIFEDCAKLMGKERIEVALNARIKWGNSTYNYPLKFTDMLKAMPPVTLARCVTGLLLAEISNAKQRDDIHNAEDALIAFYGSPIYEYFFEEFTHRYWGIHPAQLSAEFIRRKMPRLSAVDILRKLIPLKRNSKKELTDNALTQETLHYSRTGSETLPRSLAKEFQRLGGTILTSATANSCDLETSSLDYHHQQKSHCWQGTQIINTAPLDQFFQLIGDQAPAEVQLAVRSLQYKPTVVNALLVNKEHCLDGLYTYFRNRVFHRIGNPKNAGLVIQPEGHSLLVVESTCEIGDDAWIGTETHRQQIIQDLSEEHICETSDIVDWKLLRNAYAYPIYRNGFDTHLSTVTSWLNKQPLLNSTGRQGGFTYPAMHTAMDLGKQTAINILSKA